MGEHDITLATQVEDEVIAFQVRVVAGTDRQVGQGVGEIGDESVAGREDRLAEGQVGGELLGSPLKLRPF
jgi:hypothetical protein